MKKRRIFALLLLLMLTVVSCGKKDENPTDTDTSESMKEEKSAEELNAELYTDRDFEIEYDESTSAKIVMNGDSAQCSSNAVEIVGTTITIKDEGTYILSGTLNDGTIIVNADKEDKTQIVLNNVDIHSETSAPIYILQADKVFLTMAEGSENSFSNGGTFTPIDENNIDSVIFSKDDLTLNGEGALEITSPAGHGIVSKDELTITSGIYQISSASHGITGKDNVCIANGEFEIAAEGDGVHSNSNVTINGGSFSIATGDDGFHADDTLTITAGIIDITESYEGLEGLHVLVSGGTISLIASDDGFNAAGGTDSSGTGGMRGGDQFGGRGAGGPGRGGMSESSEGSIVISGGTISINASGDGLDANGTLEISGGTIIVSGPFSGDTATLDYDTSGIITGGTFIGTGASGMAQTFSDSEQGVIAVNAGNQAEGTKITLEDQNGNVILEHEAELSFAVVILSSPDIKSGDTYKITVGEISGEFAAS